MRLLCQIYISRLIYFRKLIFRLNQYYLFKRVRQAVQVRRIFILKKRGQGHLVKLRFGIFLILSIFMPIFWKYIQPRPAFDIAIKSMYEHLKSVENYYSWLGVIVGALILLFLMQNKKHSLRRAYYFVSLSLALIILIHSAKAIVFKSYGVADINDSLIEAASSAISSISTLPDVVSIYMHLTPLILGSVYSSIWYGVGLAVVAITIQWTRSRFFQRLAITQFSAIHLSKNDGPQLAAQLQAALFKELNLLSKILTQHPMSKASTIRMDSDQLAWFVTDGLGDTAFTELRNISNFDVGYGNFRIPAAALAWLAKFLFRYRLAGELTPVTTDQFRLTVRLIPRSGNPIVIDRLFTINHATHLVDELVLKSEIQSLAADLINTWFGLKFSTLGLVALIKGLHASYDEKWWLAQYYYARVVRYEEAPKPAWATGMYHLGATYVRLGEFSRAIEFFQNALQQGNAIKHGFALERTYYMRALARMYLHYFELHKRKDIVEKIKADCDRAIEQVNLTQKTLFAEAYHLKGMMYYMLGRLKERDAHKYYGKQISDIYNEKSEAYIEDYWRSSHNLKLATKGYKRSPLDTHHTHATARHQLADSYRGQAQYARAVENYMLVERHVPENMRNNLDLAKTYCLLSEWSEVFNLVGYEYLPKTRRDAEIHQKSWDADKNFYAGWAALGMANDVKSDGSTRFYLELALRHLDFALHQRPRYMTRWIQNNWYRELDAICTQDYATEKESRFSQYKEVRGLLKSDILDHVANSESDLRYTRLLLICWISWRMAGFNYFEEQSESYGGENYKKLDQSLRYIYKLQMRTLQVSLETDMRRLRKTSMITNKCQSQLARLVGKQARTDALNLEYPAHLPIEDLNELYDLKHKVFRELVEFLDAKFFKNCVNAYNLKERISSIKVFNRFEIDVLAQLAILNARLLIWTEDYNLAYEITNKTVNVLNAFADAWPDYIKTGGNKSGQASQDKGYFQLSPLVLRYQRATLHSWAAYALLHLEDHLIDPALSNEGSNQILQTHLRKALGIMPDHVLGMYTQALWNSKVNLQAEATIIFERLRQEVVPFDPSRTITKPAGKTREYRDSVRNEMWYQEQVAGRQQFSYLINEQTLHRAMARNYTEAGATQWNIRHYHLSIASASRQRRSPKHLIEFANELLDIEAFEEASSILNEVGHTEYLQQDKASYRRLNQQRIIMESVLTNRQGHYIEARQTSLKMAARFQFTELSEYENYYDKSFLPIEESKASFFGISNLDVIDQLQEALSSYEDLKEKYTKFLISEPSKSDKRHLREFFQKSSNLVSHFQMPPPSRTLRGDLTTLSIKPELKFQAPLCLKSIQTRNLFLALKLAQNLLAAPNKLKGCISVNQYAKRATESKELPYWVQPVTQHMGEAAIQELISLADLCNNLAYTKAVQNQQFRAAYHEIRFSILILRFLWNSIEAQRPNHPLYDPLRKRLAYAYDTECWIYFQHSQLHAFPNMTPHGGCLIESLALAKMALRKDSGRAIIYAHSAAVNLFCARLTLDYLDGRDKIRSGEMKPLLNSYLGDAADEIRSAKDYDHTNRLSILLYDLREKHEYLLAERQKKDCQDKGTSTG